MNDPRVEAAANRYDAEIGDGTYLDTMREALAAADRADREQGVHRVRVNQAFEQRLFHVIEAVIVDRNKVLNVGLSDDVTDAVLAALTGAES